jgi:hypothetical protein
VLREEHSGGGFATAESAGEADAQHRTTGSPWGCPDEALRP